MKKAILIFAVIGLMLLSTGCKKGGGDEVGITESPFIGGTTGVLMSFAENAPPEEVFDAGEFPFDIIVKLKNNGEHLVERAFAKVTITGFEPTEFGVTTGDLTKVPEEDLEPVKTDSQGNRVEPPEVFVEFNNLNHVESITGSQLIFPIKADVCYKYGTTATATLCVRENLLNPEEGGICEVNEAKEVFNSGAPVQITSITESARSKDKIAFAFTVSHVGNGNIYTTESSCDKSSRTFKNVIQVDVSTGFPGLSCSGLGEAGSTSGQIKLIGSSREITCTQSVPTPTDFVSPVTITLGYDYEDDISTQITVKHIGE